jgi:hypothetical protein
MRLLCPVIGVLIRNMYRFRHHFPMRYRVATQLVGNDLPRFITMASQQTLEEAFRSCPIALCLQVNVNHFVVLVYRSPQIVLLAVLSLQKLHRCRRCRRSLDFFVLIA